jgi:hypothetical protein
VVISALVGSVSGEVQTRLNVAIPASFTTVATKCEPCAYCFIFRSMPSIRRIVCSSRPADPRRALNAARISATEGTTCGPTASIT